jgi:glycogen phosphorylase
VLDGWWAEAYDGTNGWGDSAITDDQGAAERDRQDARHAVRDPAGRGRFRCTTARREARLFAGWVSMCKRSMASVLPHFNSERVIHDYARLFYARRRSTAVLLAENDFLAARDLADWKHKVRGRWPGVQLKNVRSAPHRVEYDERPVLEVDVTLNGLHRKTCVSNASCARTQFRPHCADQGLCRQPAQPQRSGLCRRRNRDACAVSAASHAVGDDVFRYRLELDPPWAGRLHFEIRAVPLHPQLSHPHELGLMRWL